MAAMASERLFGAIPIFPCLDSDCFFNKCVSLSCMKSVQATTNVKLFDLRPLRSGSLLLQRHQGVPGEGGVFSAFISFHLLFK